MATKKKSTVEKLILPIALVGIGYFVWKSMQEKNQTQTTGAGQGQGLKNFTTKVKTFFSTPEGIDASLKQACDDSYSAIGVNRYLCYKGQKAPKTNP